MSFPTQWKVGETEKKVVIFCNRTVTKIWKSSRLGRSGVSPISCHKLNTHPDTLIKLFIQKIGTSAVTPRKFSSSNLLGEFIDFIPFNSQPLTLVCGSVIWMGES